MSALPPAGSAGKFLTGLIGRNILASRSPWLHEQEADAIGARLVYTLFDFTARGWDDAELPKLLDALERIGFAGVNVTFPFKQAIIPYLDELSEGARRIGAVNTVAFVDGKRIGHNTDVIGFGESFVDGLPGVAHGRVVQFGAGGAGSATAYALLERGVGQLALVDNDAERAAGLVAQLERDFGAGRAVVAQDAEAAVAAADGIVNATPMGMAAYPGTSLPVAWLEPRHWVIDIVYFPLETELLREAAARGCRTVNGIGMVVGQAAAGFEIFTGLRVDRQRMLDSFARFVPSA